MSGGKVVAWRCTAKGIVRSVDVTADRLLMEDYRELGRKIEPLVLQSDLATAIARAEADSRRLDWLDSHRGDDVQRDRNGAPELVAHYWGVQGQCYDVREAIDREQAAIAAQQAEGEA